MPDEIDLEALNTQIEKRIDEVGIENLSPPEQRYFRLMYLEMAIMSNGLSNWFETEAANAALVVLDDLKQLKATKAHKAFSKALKAIPGGYTPDQMERINRLDDDTCGKLDELGEEVTEDSFYGSPFLQAAGRHLLAQKRNA
jgi:hypothetical protein